MKTLRRLLVAAIVVGGLVGAITQSRAAQSSFEPSTQLCTAGAMRDGMNHAGRDVVVKVWQFGCEGRWAYVWADVAAGPNAIGVTNVMLWRADLLEWRSVDRAIVCREELLPSLVYRQGCFSN